MNEKNQKHINTLIETRINGNSIDSSSYYKNLLKQITKEDLALHVARWGDGIKLYGTKAEIIEQMKEQYVSWQVDL